MVLSMVSVMDGMYHDVVGERTAVAGGRGGTTNSCDQTIDSIDSLPNRQVVTHSDEEAIYSNDDDDDRLRTR